MSKAKPPAKVNNFKTNKVTVAKSRNVEPMIYIKARNIEDVQPVVNGEVADKNLIHKPKPSKLPKPPIITKGNKNGPKQKSRQSLNRSSENSKENGLTPRSAPRGKKTDRERGG